MSLERLVQDGRIHPARIEEVVAATSKEMEEELIRIGKEAAQEANLPIGQAGDSDAGPTGVSHELWTERAEAFAGGGVFVADDRG